MNIIVHGSPPCVRGRGVAVPGGVSGGGACGGVSTGGLPTRGEGGVELQQHGGPEAAQPGRCLAYLFQIERKTVTMIISHSI